MERLRDHRVPEEHDDAVTAGAAAPSPVWRLAPGQQLAHRSWDGEHVVYNDLSGDTHLLDDVSMHLLTALQQAPRAEDALARAAGCAATALESRLAGLAALSLIECIAW